MIDKFEIISQVISLLRNKSNDYLLFTDIFSIIHNMLDYKFAGIGLIDSDESKIGIGIGLYEGFGGSIIGNYWYKTVNISHPQFSFLSSAKDIMKVDAENFYGFHKTSDSQSELKERFIQEGVKEFYLIAIKINQEVIGKLMISTSSNEILDNSIVELLILISNIFAEVFLRFKEAEESMFRRKMHAIQIRLFDLLISMRNRSDFISLLGEEINRWMPSDFIGVIARSPEDNKYINFGLLKVADNKFKNINIGNVAVNSLGQISELNADVRNNFIELNNELLQSSKENSAFIKKLVDSYSINSLLIVKYSVLKQGTLYLISGRVKPYQPVKPGDFMFLYNSNSYFNNAEIKMTTELLPQIALILGFFYMYEELTIVSQKLEQEKSYLIEEINFTNTFYEIIGDSLPVQNMLKKITQVAPLDATVLIQGETGTGKELVAKAIHNLSRRSSKPFITVNCAALPAQLIESELFGHEKGSFTGAIERKIGKFEIAEGGTIFLDEIGELPIELQSKLLRVIQNRNFERIGGKNVIESNIRIIAATNRDLEKEIANGKFRADLFFRLNVFPIDVPPLRERKDDIPSLVKHFVDIYSKRIGSNIKSIKKTDMELLLNYSWPGNIRELEHLIERSIIISKGLNLNFEDYFISQKTNEISETEDFKTLVELEKQHIVDALNRTGGKVTGENSASQLLGINGKTLGSKMRKLGIKREVVISTK